MIEMGQTIFWGIDNINMRLDEIIKPLKLEKYYFEIKLIMLEAITNAFIHGNNSDESKPIIVKWNVNSDSISISVEDSGHKNRGIEVQNTIDEDEILSENGRGMFIISQYTDKVEFNNGCLIMKKLL